MAIRDDFFTALQNGAKWDVGVSINRTNPLPLDLNSVFASYDELLVYAKGVLSYPGQPVAVIGADEATLYVLDQNKDPQEVGKSTNGDNKSISLNAETGVLSLFGFENVKEGQQLRVANTAAEGEDPVYKLEWFTPSTETVEGLQASVGSLQDTVYGVEGEDGTRTGGLTTRMTTVEGNISVLDDKVKDIEGQLTGIFHFKGSKDTYSDLTSAVTNNEYTPVTGDVWNIKTAGGHDADGVYIEAGDNVVYNGTGWDVLSNAVDLTGYYTKTEVDNAIDADVSVAKDAAIATAAADATAKANAAQAAAEQTAANALTPVSEKANANETAINELKGKVGNAASGDTAATGLYAELDKKANAADVSLKVDELQGNIDKKADSTTVTSLQTQVENLNSTTVDTTAMENYVAGQLTNYVTQGEKTTLEASISTAKDVADSAKATAEANTTQIGVNTGKISTLESTVSEHTTKLGTLETALGDKVSNSDFTTALGNKADKSELSLTNEKVTSQGERITALEETSATKSDLKTVSDKADANETAIEGHKTRIEALETNSATKESVNEVASNLSIEVENRVAADTAMGERITALEGQITGLSGAMHFKGKLEALPEDVSSYADGDVIIVGDKEYVFNNGSFIELGDVSAEGARITALEAADALINADIEALEGSITALNTKVGALPEGQTSVVGYIETSVTSLNGSIDALNTKVGTLPTGYTSVVNYIEEYSSNQVDAHESVYHVWNEF